MNDHIPSPGEAARFYQLLFEVSQALNLARDLDEGLASFARIIRHHLNVTSLAVLIPDSGSGFKIIHQIRMSAGTLRSVTTRIADQFSRFLAGDCQEDVSPEEPLSYLLNFSEKGLKKYFYLVPLVTHSKYQGVLVMVQNPGSGKTDKKPDYYYDLNFLSLLGNELAALIERNQLAEKLETDKEKLRILYRIGRSVNSTFEEEKILNQTLVSENPLFRHDIGAFLEARDEYGAEINVFTKKNPSRRIISATVAEIIKMANKELSLSRSLKQKEVRTSLHVASAQGRLQGKLASSIACPVKIENKRCAMFYVGTISGEHYTAEHLYLFSTICYHAASAIENARAFKKHQKMAFTDPITGLYNHRYFQETLDRELGRAMRYDSPLSLMLLDIDFFKRFNDTYGHQQGDTVLHTLGGLLKEHSRAVDTPARYGGEEFVIILPETARNGALKRADRLREEVSKYPVRLKNEDVTVTVSIGLANYPEDGITSKRDLIEKADQALYRAKTEGRNRVCSYQEVKTLDILETRPMF